MGMQLVSNAGGSAGCSDVVVQGPLGYFAVPSATVGWPASIPLSSNFTSAVLPSYGYPHIICGVTASQNGALNVQRYVDSAGTIPQGSALTSSITGGTAVLIDTNDGKGFLSYTVQVTNTSGTTASTLTKVVMVLMGK